MNEKKIIDTFNICDTYAKLYKGYNSYKSILELDKGNKVSRERMEEKRKLLISNIDIVKRLLNDEIELL